MPVRNMIRQIRLPRALCPRFAGCTCMARLHGPMFTFRSGGAPPARTCRHTVRTGAIHDWDRIGEQDRPLSCNQRLHPLYRTILTELVAERTNLLVSAMRDRV